MSGRERLLLNRYKTTEFKKNEAIRNNNESMCRIYKKELKTIRMVLSTLGIHIDGINR